MGDIEKAWLTSASRRSALINLAGLVAGAPVVAAAQPDPRPLSGHGRALTLGEMQTSFDFEPVFFGNVPLRIYDYTAHGDGSEWTLRRNREAFDWIDILRSRAPVQASQVDLSSELLGFQMKYPIIVAPTATQLPLHPDGEIGMFKGAVAASNTLFMLSGNTSTPAARVVPAAPTGTVWHQFYPAENLANTQRTLDGYLTAGCKAIIVTLDQNASYYERTQQSRNFGGTVRTAPAAPATPPPPPRGSARYRVNGGRLWYTWQYVDEVRKLVKTPLLVKGIERPEDARLAIEHGVDGIIVSNHGGRSMDYGPSTIEILPEIVAAVNGRVPVLIDSGFRRGSDIFKALALGAKGVMLGRATRWGLGAYGTPGAQRVIEMLQQELVQVAAQAGCAKLADINGSTVRANFT